MKPNIINTLNPGQQPGRQGDVLLTCINPDLYDIDWHDQYATTNGVSLKDSNQDIILAYGEKTGHQHALYGGNAFLVKAKNKKTNEETFVLCVLKEHVEKHGCNQFDKGDHDPIKLPVGYYEVSHQYEYREKKLVRVVD